VTLDPRRCHLLLGERIGFHPGSVRLGPKDGLRAFAGVVILRSRPSSASAENHEKPVVYSGISPRMLP
jgi:hypothetical protein